MKKILTTILAVTAFAAQAQNMDSTKVKRGWNMGILPSVAFDADYGFQGGLLTNVYYYGDGSQYPEYIHSIFAEGAYTTKRRGIFRVNYDSKYLIPNHRLTIDATYLPDAMCDFYGFNGYQSIYNSSWSNWKHLNETEYQSRVYYKMKRDLVRLAGDLEGPISGHLHWNGGVGILGYVLDECDVDHLNGDNTFDSSLPRSQQKPLDPNLKGLYERYCDWGLITPEERNGGWHPYLRGGISLDSRNKRQGPTRGIYADAFLTYSAAFGKQAQAGYNHLQLNLTFRHYIQLMSRDRLTLAYRIGTQNLIAGKSPFYMNSYLNTQFIQRVIYEGLGGANSLRGILANRICSDGFLYANIEIRSRVANFDVGNQHIFIGLNPFVDMGMVTQPYQLRKSESELRSLLASEGLDYDEYFSSKDLHTPHLAAGIGLKVGMNENFVLSVDWATPMGPATLRHQDNDKISNLYIKMGYLF